MQSKTGFHHDQDNRACAYVKDIRVGKLGGRKLVRIAVDPVPSDKIVYFNKKIPNGPYVQEIYVRRGNEKNNLIGFDRDQFVRERFTADMMKKMRQVKADAPKISAEELLQGFQAMIAPQLRSGATVVVTGGQPLTEATRSDPFGTAARAAARERRRNISGASVPAFECG